MDKFAGEYPSNETKVSRALNFAKAGFATFRLERHGELNPSGQASVTAVVRNLGDTNVTLQFVSLDSVSFGYDEDDQFVSGERVDIGDPVAVVAGGLANVQLTPPGRYLEVKTTAGEGDVAIELAGIQRWTPRPFVYNGKPDNAYPHAVIEGTGTRAYQDSD